jgi:Mlc titration factor MtfA (ptsG expression regulator)
MQVVLKAEHIADAVWFEEYTVELHEVAHGLAERGNVYIYVKCQL